MGELFDLLDQDGNKTGATKDRKLVHQDVTAGEESLPSAMRESFEELGVQFPKEAFEFLFTCKIRSVQNDGAFVNNEFDDVYLVSMKQEVPPEAFVLDEAEVDAVKWVGVAELEAMYRNKAPALVPADVSGPGAELVQVQCLTFDAPYQKLVPPEAR